MARDPETKISYPALAHRNFRLLWSGQCVSLVGTTMQNAAVLWHVATWAEPGQKALALGFVGLVRVVPILLLALLGGVIADRFERRKVMTVTQLAMALCAALLCAVTLSGNRALWPIYVLTALSAGAAAFDQPARQALVPMLVPRAVVANAVSLNTMLFQLASIVGPAAFAVFLIWFDIGWIYAINALSFAPVIVALAAMRGLPAPSPGTRASATWSSAVEGVRFVVRTPLVRAAMLLDFAACFFASASALLPIFATDVLHVGPTGFGWLYSAQSLGAVAASIYLLKHEARIRRYGVVLIGTVAVYGFATVGFGLSTSYAITFACLAVAGAADTVNMVLRNVVRQLETPDAMRGRMSGVNVIFAKGGPELGEVEAGVVAHHFGPAFSVVSGGVLCLACTAWIAWKTPGLRRYVRESETVVRGPKLAPGDERATRASDVSAA